MDKKLSLCLSTACPQKGLIIDEPWISYILSGQKVWEMRSQATKLRGTIALIRKGSGLIVGQADLIDSLPSLSIDQMIDCQDKHQVPEEMIRTPGFKWFVPWVLSNVVIYDTPIPYQHKRGAVIWVNL